MEEPPKHILQIGDPSTPPARHAVTQQWLSGLERRVTWNSFYLNRAHKPGTAAHSCNPRTPKMELRGSRVHGKPQLHYKFVANLGYMKPDKTKQKTQDLDNMPLNFLTTAFVCMVVCLCVCPQTL